MGGRSGIIDGTGFRFCGVILLRLDLLRFVGDEGTVEGARDDGGDGLESFFSSWSHRAVSHRVTMFSGTISFPRWTSWRKSVGFPIVILATLCLLGVDDAGLMKPRLLETRRCTRTGEGDAENGRSKSSKRDTEQVRRESMVVRCQRMTKKKNL